MRTRNSRASKSGRGLPHSKTLCDLTYHTKIRRFWSAAVVCRLFVLVCAATSVIGADVERIGTIDAEIKECSGVVASRRFPEVFWVHSDGAREHLYAINRKDVIL